MNKDENDNLYVRATKHIIEYPRGLEKFMPVDDMARSLVLVNRPDVSKNILRYFNEQGEIKQTIGEMYEKLDKLFVEYQTNCQKLIDYLKGLNL